MLQKLKYKIMQLYDVFYNTISSKDLTNSTLLQMDETAW